VFDFKSLMASAAVGTILFISNRGADELKHRINLNSRYLNDFRVLSSEGIPAQISHKFEYGT
jgi:hypothetical protein